MIAIINVPVFCTGNRNKEVICVSETRMGKKLQRETREVLVRKFSQSAQI